MAIRRAGCLSSAAARRPRGHARLGASSPGQRAVRDLLTPKTAALITSFALCAATCARPTPVQPGGEIARSEALGAADTAVHSRQRALMGTWFSVQVVSDDSVAAAEAIDAAFDEVARVESEISEWRDGTDMTAVNDGAGQGPVAVGPDLLFMVERAREVSVMTSGAFDISFAGCGHLWSIRERRIPPPEDVEACLPLVDFEAIAVDHEASTVALLQPGMRIGSGAIGKGYGVDRAAQVLEDAGFRDYVIDGGGDIRISGMNGDRAWTVGIAHPRNEDEIYGTLSTTSGAVVTSGDYQRYFELDGVRYHHILDPATGQPARRSVATTVIAPDATLADALSTGVFVLGPERGLALVETLDGVEAFVVDPQGEVHMSSGFGDFFTPAEGGKP